MFALFSKEIKSFFTSILGYIIVGVFFVLTGLFVWVFRGNVIETGRSTLQGFFDIAPMLFLILIPAITMRMFAEERKSGTIELLFTQPISDGKLIAAKFLACEVLLLIALLPTLIYFWSVWQLGATDGKIDVGATWCSYLGLFLLGTIFVSIGLFASSITKNQIVAFLLAALFCFLMHYGFNFIYDLDFLGSAGYVVKKIGIEHHYSYISMGVIDSRDIIYYITVSFLFLLGTRISLLSRKW